MAFTWQRMLFRYKLNTCLRLGLRNIATVVLYRIAKQSGYYKHRLPVGQPIQGPFFFDSVAEPEDCFPLNYFSYHTVQVTSPPDWFINPWNNARCPDSGRHWSELSDFMPELCDIKTVWEASRFDWLPRMAWDYRNGDKPALARLELWLRDWAKQNPVNSGINWKCGQEASLRCLNMLAAALILDDYFACPFDRFLQFLATHLQRIVPTFHYAMAQDNNHGVSEAAALFAVGQYLKIHGDPAQQKKAKKWAELGRSWLQNCVKKLIMPDGSFSQHSITYHRLVLDVLSFVELLRTRLEVEPFEDLVYERIRAAVRWLHTMTDSRTGDAPNLGSNDGAYVFNLKRDEYRDVRSSIQLGAAVFLQRAVWPNKVAHPLLEVFSCDIKKFPLLKGRESSTLPQGGYACLRNRDSFALLRLPIYRFRPSHADALHVDFWLKGENLLRDGGSYSYNAGDEITRYFGGTASHNTIQFDDRDQMPRLSRFLFGEWLKASNICPVHEQDGVVCASAAYSDYQGARHHRTVSLASNSLQVHDVVSGFRRKAVLRWRLRHSEWIIHNKSITNGQQRLTVEASAPVCRFEIVDGWESRYYLQKASIPVLEIEIHQAGELTTTYLFNQ